MYIRLRYPQPPCGCPLSRQQLPAGFPHLRRSSSSGGKDCGNNARAACRGDQLDIRMFHHDIACLKRRMLDCAGDVVRAARLYGCLVYKVDRVDGCLDGRRMRVEYNRISCREHAIVLQRTVSLGFVHGVIAPITPNGPISMRVSPLSPDHAVVVISSVPESSQQRAGVLKSCVRHFPCRSPVRPMRARISAFSIIFLRMLEITFSLWSRDILATTFCASLPPRSPRSCQ